MDAFSLLLTFFANFLASLGLADSSATPFLLQWLIFLNVADYLFGTMVAFRTRTVSSHIGINGIMRKVTVWMYVLLSLFIEAALAQLGVDLPLAFFVLVGLNVAEGYSLIEHGSIFEKPPALLLAVLKYFDEYQRAATQRALQAHFRPDPGSGVTPPGETHVPPQA